MEKQQNSKKKKARKWTIIGSIVLIIVFLIVAKKMEWIGKKQLERVTTENPAMRTIVEMITSNGKVQPITEVKISPDVSGEIVELNVEEGQEVKKGDLLIKIEPDTYISIKERAEASVNSAKSQLEQFKAQLVLARQTYNRQKQLFENNVIPAADLESAESQYKALISQVEAAEFNVKSAEATLKEAQENLNKTVIYAPNDGTVSLLNVELGERVVGTATMAGTEMLRIADLSAMEVRAEVNENDIVRVSLADSADIEIDAYAGRKFKGIVSRIANSSQSVISGTVSSDQVTNFEVRIFILPESYSDLVKDDSPSPFRPGMSASVDIKTDMRYALSIPIQAVTSRSVGQSGERKEVVFVYRTDSSMVRQTVVTTGIQDKRYIEVTSGIDSTDQVVTAPFIAISRNLQEGAKVQKVESLNAMASSKGN